MQTTRVGWRHDVLTGLILCWPLLVSPVLADQETVQKGQDDSALQRRALSLNDVTGDDTIKAEIQDLAKDSTQTKKLLATAVKLAKQKDQPFTYNGAYILALVAHQQKDIETATVFYRICIDQSVKLFSGKKLAQSYEGLINLLSQNKKYDDSAKACLEFLELPEDGNLMRPVQEMKSAVYRRLIQSLARASQFDKAHKLVDTLLEGRPDSWQLLDLRGFVQREEGQFAKAAKTYEDIKERIAKDKALTADERAELMEMYRYTLSSVYVDLKNVDKAADELKALLAAKPNDPTYNNDLGYIWADHDMNLDEAERLIRKALDEDRKQRRADPDAEAGDDHDNAAYLDSIGWVLYKKKKYAEAKKYLLQAVGEKDGQHIEILDHLADVHMALGEKKEAQAIWKKALEIEARDHRERHSKTVVEKKLKASQ